MIPAILVICLESKFGCFEGAWSSFRFGCRYLLRCCFYNVFFCPCVLCIWACSIYCAESQWNSETGGDHHAKRWRYLQQKNASNSIMSKNTINLDACAISKKARKTWEVADACVSTWTVAFISFAAVFAVPSIAVGCTPTRRWRQDRQEWQESRGKGGRYCILVPMVPYSK